MYIQDIIQSHLGGQIIKLYYTQWHQSGDRFNMPSACVLQLENNYLYFDTRLFRPGGQWYASIRVHATKPGKDWWTRVDHIMKTSDQQQRTQSIKAKLHGFACFFQVVSRGGSLQDRIVLTLDSGMAILIGSEFCRPDGSNSAKVSFPRLDSAPSLLQACKNQIANPSFWSPELEAVFGTVDSPLAEMQSPTLGSLREAIGSLPFVPLDIVLNSGVTYEIDDPQCVWIGDDAEQQFVLNIGKDMYLILSTAMIAKILFRPRGPGA